MTHVFCDLRIEKLLPKQIPLPPLNGLRAFEAAGRRLNFRAAAEELGVTQGAVAQQVRGLEDNLGLKLFERLPKGLAFTSAGRAYHAEIAAAFGLLHRATETLRPAPKRVTISVTPTFASKWLIPRLPDFADRHPEIDLRILATEGLSSFEADGIDLAIRQARAPFGASLDARLLFRHEVIAVCAPGLVAGRDLPLSPDELTKLPPLHDTHDLWPRFRREVMGLEDLARQRGVRFSQTTLTFDAALAGQGVALASRFLVEQDLTAGRLVQPVAGRLVGDKDFHMLARSKAHRRPVVDDVMDWLAQVSDDVISP